MEDFNKMYFYETKIVEVELRQLKKSFEESANTFIDFSILSKVFMQQFYFYLFFTMIQRYFVYIQSYSLYIIRTAEFFELKELQAREDCVLEMNLMCIFCHMIKRIPNELLKFFFNSVQKNKVKKVFERMFRVKTDSDIYRYSFHSD